MCKNLCATGMYENQMDELATLMKAGLESKLVKDKLSCYAAAFITHTLFT